MGTARGLLIAAGALAMVYALFGALTDSDLKIGGVLLFLGIALVLHDGVLMPLVIGVGALLTRAPPLIRAAMVVSLVVTLVALPFVLGYGRSPDNPSVLPLPYGKGLAIILVAIWTTTLVLLAIRRLGARRRELWRRRDRQKIVRMRTTPQSPSDG
ncbi:hypothetical protein AB0368_34215 [Actinoplanes sp. NPDC051475]|uniref:hypothetical protein n=1 Tax=Actinoplanes sp. NPDC051475 TaxID=3157225 RepID=UPI00344E47F0